MFGAGDCVKHRYRRSGERRQVRTNIRCRVLNQGLAHRLRVGCLEPLQDLRLARIGVGHVRRHLRRARAVDETGPHLFNDWADCIRRCAGAEKHAVKGQRVDDKQAARRAGCRFASIMAMRPPIEWPITAGFPMRFAASQLASSSTAPRMRPSSGAEVRLAAGEAVHLNEDKAVIAGNPGGDVVEDRRR